MRVQSSDRKPQERDARLFDATWGWLAAALILAVLVAIIAITTSVMRSSTSDGPLAMRPPADDPANPPAAAAPNTARTVNDGQPR